jgi:hypothetical protein
MLCAEPADEPADARCALLVAWAISTAAPDPTPGPGAGVAAVPALSPLLTLPPAAAVRFPPVFFFFEACLGIQHEITCAVVKNKASKRGYRVVIVRLFWATSDLECRWPMNRVACSPNLQRLLQKHAGRSQGAHKAAAVLQLAPTSRCCAQVA